MSHQIKAFMAMEFTNNIKQPTRSQELRRTKSMSMLLICHGRQANERMHPERVVVVKRASSVEGVMKGTRGRGRERFRKSHRHIIYTGRLRPRLLTTHPADNQRRTNDCLVLFVRKMNRPAPNHRPLPNVWLMGKQWSPRYQ